MIIIQKRHFAWALQYWTDAAYEISESKNTVEVHGMEEHEIMRAQGINID